MLFSFSPSKKRNLARRFGVFFFQSVGGGIGIETASVIDFALRRANENMVVPFVVEIPAVAYGNVNAFVFRTLDKSGEAVMVFSDVYKLPVIFTAHCFQVVDIFGLKGFVVFAGVAPRRKFIIQLFFEFRYFCHR